MSQNLWQRLTRGAWAGLQSEEWPLYAGSDWLNRIMDVAVTDRFHAKQGRSTGRLVLKAKESKLTVYLKRHYRLGRWHGLLATLWPQHGWTPAFQEWRHLEWARSQGLLVPRSVAAGELIGPWGKLQSFLAVEELMGMLPLHEAIPLAADHFDSPGFIRWKRGLITEMARLVRKLHEKRYFHKDLYLCHFYIPERTCSAGGEHGASAYDFVNKVSLIDLHRLGHHRCTWPIWQIKDLAQLAYSTEIKGIHARDRLRFWRQYWGSARRGLLSSIMRSAILIKWRRYQRHNAKRRKSLTLSPQLVATHNGQQSIDIGQSE
ncbi:MAG: lipopolysaccharide kinase InaA family protein [Gemmataceae bacterium]